MPKTYVLNQWPKYRGWQKFCQHITGILFALSKAKIRDSGRNDGMDFVVGEGIMSFGEAGSGQVTTLEYRLVVTK